MAEFSRLFAEDGNTTAEFPQVYFPIVYADGVLSATRGANVKTYFYRIDPHPFAKGGANQVPNLQVVMPSDGFAAMAVFFAQTLANLVTEGKVSADYLDKVIEACKTVKNEASVHG